MLGHFLRSCGILLLVTCLSSCIHDEANRYYGDGTLPPKAVDEVELLRKAPNRPYKVLADLQARLASPKHMLRRAAEIGADAVIVVPVGGYYYIAEVWADNDRHDNTYSRLLGTAIQYLGDP